MRRLMWFVIGFTGAMALSAYLLHNAGALLLVFCGLALTAALVLLFVRGKYIDRIRLILFGIAFSFAWMWMFHSFYLSGISDAIGTEQELVVEIADYSTETDYGITADGTVKLDGKTYRIRLYANDFDPLYPGDCVHGKVELESTYEGTERMLYHSGTGVHLLGYLRSGQIVRADSVNLKHYPALIRHRILSLLQQMLPEDTLPFAQALLIGDQSKLDYETNTDLSVSGIRHVVAVSGLHVSVLCALVFSLLGHRRVLTPLVGISLLVLFASVTGFTPSVVRSCIMYGLMFGSLALQREYDAPTALSFAVLVMLIVNPLAITSVGLQLSCCCVIGIFLFSSGIREFILGQKCLGRIKLPFGKGKIKRWIAGSVSITISTMITTTPLCAAYFGTISIFGVVTNLLTLWVITFVFCGLLGAVVVGAIWLPAGKIICAILSWPIRYVLFIARKIASVPLAAVYTESPYVILWIVFVYVLLFVFWRSKKRYPWFMTTSALFGLAVAIMLSWVEPRLDSYRFTVLDVGQGQCVLLRSDDKNYMIDCGGDSDTAVADLAARTLLSQGVTRLDGLILTHYDRDHSGAAQNLITRIPVDTFYLPVLTDADKNYEEVIQVSQGTIVWVDKETIVTIPNTCITICSGSNELSDNESSLCVLFQPENCDILICGDRGLPGERDLLAQMELPLVEVLVVGHHGGKNSTGLELLHAIQPKTAIISVGKENRYGHPADEVLERLELFGCSVLRTDIHGAITIRG